MKLLPNYARNKSCKFPQWKANFIKRNRVFYKKYQKQLNPVLPELQKYFTSLQKFEWNCINEERIISKHLIQFRASGIRVRKNNCFPSLVVPRTQIPIIGWENRFITIKEAAKLQSLGMISMPSNEKLAFQALGNAVNSEVVFQIGKALFGYSKKSKNSELLIDIKKAI